MAYGTLKSDVVQSSTAGTPPQFNDGNGIQTGTLCRAWANFNGAAATIRASFNVSSITRNASGDFTVNLTNAMPDANYGITACAAIDNSNTGGRIVNTPFNGTSASTSAFRLSTQLSGGTASDCTFVYVAVHR